MTKEKELQWHIRSKCLEFEAYPHEEISIDHIDWKKYPGALMARWTTDFDCAEETRFWYCIKDTSFQIEKMKAKRRYEITKGTRNFYTKEIDPLEYGDEIYHVYSESLKGYSGNPKPISRFAFQSHIDAWGKNDAVVFFGCFSRDTNQLCGYADVYRWGKYIPISSLKTIPDCERGGVNAALVYGIVSYFEVDITRGGYLCDGARNVVHETNFQDYLIKYFGFRRAYCKLHLAYRPWFGLLVKCVYPFRKLLSVNKRVRALLKMDEWASDRKWEF